MRNKNKTKTILLTLGLIFTFFTIVNYNMFNINLENDVSIEFENEIDFKSLKRSSYWNLNFIHIDNNWSATADSYDWCSGDGSWSSPYRIENVSIDASSSPTGNGILINNSKSDYFIISN